MRCYRWSDKAGELIFVDMPKGSSALQIQTALDGLEKDIRTRRIVRDLGTYNFKIVEGGE